MITYLNDRDWLLRHAFFESIVDVAACVGGRSLEEYILPLMIQALSGELSNLWNLDSRRFNYCNGKMSKRLRWPKFWLL
jgi:phosphoinositide-3-kinase regulatory subunit 4